MKRLQAFKYETMPTGEQERLMRFFAGLRRRVFNDALNLQKARHERGEKLLGYAKLCRELTSWRNSPETAWLSDGPIHPQQQALKDLGKAYERFFSDVRKGLRIAPDSKIERRRLRSEGVKLAYPPTFKKKGQHDSFRYPDPKQIKLDHANSRVFLPKLGWLRYRKSREVLGEVKNVTVGLRDKKWSISIQTVRQVERPIPCGSAVGIDLGVVRFATLSDGTVIPPLNIYKRYADTLRKAQQAVGLKKKYSNNWKKAKAKVQRIHTRIANTRRDFLHKTSTDISKNHAMIAIEDLQVKNMSRSAAGSVEQPGKNVRAKTGLNRAILDQGWYEFRRQLEYKLAWNGGRLVVVPPQNTSRACPNPACGHVSADNRKTQAQFKCVKCGYEENADFVSANNVLRAGHAQLACQVNGEVSRQQQEPTEVTAQPLQ